MQIFSSLGRNVSVVNGILTERPQRRRGGAQITRNVFGGLPWKLYPLHCLFPHLWTPFYWRDFMCFVFSLFVCLVVNLSDWRYFHPCCCMCLCWRSCLCVCVCVYVIGRVWIFVVNLGDWRQVPGWQWSHGQPEPGWLLGRRWFTAGILSETNTTSYSALIKHQKKGLRPQAFRSGKCFNPTTSKSRIYILETFGRINFIEVCQTINYTRF